MGRRGYPRPVLLPIHPIALGASISLDVFPSFPGVFQPYGRPRDRSAVANLVVDS
jgi:hypothetical protein